MFLRRLQLHGFKSFADKTTLEFAPGVTAVVGPNGSGKSNISDAIRWVLGEQSARNLRGSRMEDIIFAGTDERRPLGMAEVSLTLDNSDGTLPFDYSEVTITRRYFRSGESQFFINRTACRLKDIQELFMDTGLGLKALSHIGQGQIDAILSARPEERRTFLEEAAGIVKYKSRKAEAERKLEDTSQKLVRVNDIISELEERIGPLEKEAEKARKYKKLHNKLRSSEIALFSVRWQRLRHTWKEWEEKRRQLARELEAKEEAIAAVEDSRLQVRRQIHEVTAASEQVAASLEESEGGAAESERRIGILQERLHHLRARIEEVSREREELLTEIAAAEERAKAKKKQVNEVQSKLAAAHFQLEEKLQLKADRDEERTALEHKLKEARAALADKTEKLQELRSRSDQVNARLQSLLERKEQIAASLESEKEELTGIVRARSECERQIDELKQEISDIGGRLQAGKQQRKRLENELQERQSRVGRLERQLGAKVSRLSALQDLDEQYEGYHRGVREVMRAESLGGLCGVVAELFKSPSHLTTALEVALGGALQNIVVETAADAKRAIEYLKNRRAGRATFLPLSDLDPRPLHSRAVSGLPGVLGIAADLVEFDPRFQPAIQYLLGRVIVAEDLDAAIAVSREVHSFGKIVTLEGELISPGGAITGGSLNRKSGLLARRREVEALREEIAALKEKYSEAVKGANEQKDALKRLNQQLEDLTEKAHTLQVSLSARENRQNALASDVARVEAGIEELTAQEGALADEIARLRAEEGELETQTAALREMTFQVEADITSLQQKLLSGGEDRDTLEAEITGLRVKVASHQERLEMLEEELAGLEDERRRLRERASKAEERIEDDRAAVARWEEEVQTCQQKRDALKAESEKLRKRIQEQRQQIESLQGKEESILTSLRQQKSEYDSRKSRLHQVEMELGRLELQTRQLEERLQENWELTFDQLGEEEVDIPEESLAKAVASTRRAMRSLGPVNLGAIDEYEAVKARYDFLTRQREDLVQARESLQDVIVTIDETSKKRFLETYDKVRTSFRKMFTRLFGGGKADLVLTDEENVLECGLEIFAQPPGKKPQHLLLLSGGERALAAIALLFAVLDVSPSPFCVLDEIDAALDDANLDRYASQLQEFAEKVQFIVVTHRQPTMERAGCLYGVTTTQKGISQLVSVKLDDKVS